LTFDAGVNPDPMRPEQGRRDGVRAALFVGAATVAGETLTR